MAVMPPVGDTLVQGADDLTGEVGTGTSLGEPLSPGENIGPATLSATPTVSVTEDGPAPLVAPATAPEKTLPMGGLANAGRKSVGLCGIGVVGIGLNVVNDGADLSGVGGCVVSDGIAWRRFGCGDSDTVATAGDNVDALVKGVGP